MGSIHAKCWADNPRAQLCAIADSDSQRAVGLARERGDGRVGIYACLGDLLERCEVDAIDVCLPHHLHAQAVVDAASAGMHVLCEKPLCITRREAMDIREAIESTNIKLMCAHNKLFALPFMEARRMIVAGAIGKVIRVQVNELSHNVSLRENKTRVDVANPGATFAWRRDPDRMGGGELIDTGWHAIYRLLALADSRVTEVAALVGNHFLDELSAEDTAQLLVAFESGVQGCVVTSWAFGGRHGGWHFEVAGTDGTLGGDETRLVYAHHGADRAKTVRWPTSYSETFSKEIDHFLSVVLEGAACESGWLEATRTLEVILAAYQSAAEGRFVALAEHFATDAYGKTREHVEKPFTAGDLV